MPSTAENIELVKIRATDQVAINIIEHVSCKFVKFVGKKSEIRGQKEIIRAIKNQLKAYNIIYYAENLKPRHGNAPIAYPQACAAGNGCQGAGQDRKSVV